MTPQWFFALLDWILSLVGKRKTHPKRKHRSKLDSRSILIVEDNPDDSDRLLMCLKHHGLDGTVSEHAEGAEVVIRRNHIRIAFVDMRLLHKPGWKLVPLIRALSPETIVVVVCGELADLANIKESFGIISVMRKPPNAQDLGVFLKRVGIL